MTRWKNITLHLPGLDLNTISDQLSVLDIASITIKDKRNENESDWFDDPENPTVLYGKTHDLVLLVSNGTDVNQLMSQIRLILNLDYAPEYSEEIFEDKDWVTYTQSLFKEILISDSLRIVPPWEAESNFSGQSIIIQPGNGFGTGTHPTTQLCIKWLHENIIGGESVLDYGCGSGILSIAAKKLGAEHVEGVEIDSLAINNARTNNELNQTSIPFYQADNFESETKYDIVVANILSSTLIKLAPTLENYTKGHLILSGIFKDQTNDVIEAYASWIELLVIDEMDGWILLEGEL